MSGDLILIVDDEPNIVSLAKMYLERDDFKVESVGDGISALDTVYSLNPTLIILDIMLPGIDGLEVCRKLRADEHPALIIMLTARDEDIDKILGLEMGADDYMTKPFNPRELVARVKAIIRRTKRQYNLDSEKLQIGDLMIHPGGREILIKGQVVKTRTQEFDLLYTLVQHRGLVLTREQLLNKAWGYDYGGQTRTVDVHIGHLRKKLTNSNVKIQTITGVGYKLLVE